MNKNVAQGKEGRRRREGKEKEEMKKVAIMIRSKTIILFTNQMRNSGSEFQQSA